MFNNDCLARKTYKINTMNAIDNRSIKIDHSIMDPEIPYNMEIPDSLLNMVMMYRHNGNMTDAQILSILIGNGIDDGMAQAAITEFNRLHGKNEITTKNKVHEQMEKYTLTGLYEHLESCMNSLRQLTQDQALSYSANTALQVCEAFVGKLPMDEINRNLSRKNAGLVERCNPTIKYVFGKEMHETLKRFDNLEPIAEYCRFIEEQMNANKYQFMVSEATVDLMNKQDSMSKMLYGKFAGLLDEEYSENFYDLAHDLATQNAWYGPARQIAEAMYAENCKKETTPQVQVEDNNFSLVKRYSPVLECEEGIIFNMNGINLCWNKTNGTIMEATVKDNKYNAVIEGLKLMNFDGKDTFRFDGYNGNYISYNVPEDTIKLNGKSELNTMSSMDLYEALQSSGVFGGFTVSNKQALDALIRLFENRGMIADLDNFTCLESNKFAGLYLTLFAVDESNYYVNIVNKGMGEHSTQKFSSATETVDYIKEAVNFDASSLVKDQLLKEGNKQQEIKELRKQINDDIIFLREQYDKVKAVYEETNNEELHEALMMLQDNIDAQEKALQDSYKTNQNEYSVDLPNFNDAEWKRLCDEEGYAEVTVSKEDPAKQLKPNQKVLVKAQEYTEFQPESGISIIDDKGKVYIVPKNILAMEIQPVD